jgi:hypothetical protein
MRLGGSSLKQVTTSSFCNPDFHSQLFYHSSVTETVVNQGSVRCSVLHEEQNVSEVHPLSVHYMIYSIAVFIKFLYSCSHNLWNKNFESAIHSE